MAAPRRRDLVNSRRRVADDGEDDDVDTVSVDDESQSEVSILTGAEESIEQGSVRSGSKSPRAFRRRATRPAKHNGGVNGAASQGESTSVKSASALATQPSFANTVDTNAIINGLDLTAGSCHEEPIQFDAASQAEHSLPVSSEIQAPDQKSATGPSTITNVNTAVKSASTTQIHGSTSRGASDPSSVPTRGGFFMHDQRNENNGRGDYGMSARGRGRVRGGYGAGSMYGNVRVPTNPTDGRWNHDLHESHSNAPPHAARPAERQNRMNPPQSAQTASVKPPSLSKTTTLGLQTMRVMLRGMEKPITYEKVPVKQHVRLPDLRPPLRRDKPVRISIQDHAAKYIFPSVDRSFIFIPRAQRPNQQRFRGRGYYSPFGSRRTSIFGGSNYTSSVAMSRRSSMARDGFMSPVDALSSRPPFVVHTGPSKPIVRLPTATRPSGPVTPAAGDTAFTAPGATSMHASDAPAYPLPSRPAFRENRPTHIPMHQPRPQKAVSVATIESPAPVRMHAPQQQEEQPFHHQVPAHVTRQSSLVDQSQVYQPATGPVNGYLTHAEQQLAYQQQPAFHPDQTPNSANGNVTEQSLNINAQQFHPGQSQIFYPQPYTMPNLYYPPPGPQNMQYSTSPIQAPPMYVQETPHGNYLIPMLAPPQAPLATQGPTEAPQGLYAQESNGTVFFYGPTQYPPSAGDVNGMPPGTYPDQAPVTDPMKEGFEQQLYFQPAQAPMMYYPTQQ